MHSITYYIVHPPPESGSFSEKRCLANQYTDLRLLTSLAIFLALQTDIDRHIDGDDDVIEQTLKISIQDEKCAYLQDIINSLKTRSYNLRVAMDFIRFAGGS